MVSQIVCTAAPESFWQSLTSTAYWQVILAIIVAYATHIFTNLSKKNAQLASAKSQAIRFGYELQQAYSNRLQSELKSNYYEMIAEFQTSDTKRDYFLEAAKHEAFSNPEQSIQISQIYGRLIECYGIIEQLSRKAEYSKVRDDVDKFIYSHGSIIVKKPKGRLNSLDKVEKYNREGHRMIEQIIENEIKLPNIHLKDQIENLRASFI